MHLSKERNSSAYDKKFIWQSRLPAPIGLIDIIQFYKSWFSMNEKM